MALLPPFPLSAKRKRDQTELLVLADRVTCRRIPVSSKSSLLSALMSSPCDSSLCSLYFDHLLWQKLHRYPHHCSTVLVFTRFNGLSSFSICCSGLKSIASKPVSFNNRCTSFYLQFHITVLANLRSHE